MKRIFNLNEAATEAFLPMALLAAIGLTACSSGMSASDKNDLLSKANVFSNNDTGSGTVGSVDGSGGSGGSGTIGSVNGTGGSGGSGGGGGGSGGPGTIGPVNGGGGCQQSSGGNGQQSLSSQATLSSSCSSIPVNLVCSDQGSQQATSYQAALQAGESITLNLNGQTCSSNPSAIATLLESGSISVTSLSALCPSAVPSSGSISVVLLINGKEQSLYRSFGQGLTVIWTTNPNDGGTTAGSQFCSAGDTASPLVIRIPQNPGVFQPLDLTPLDAIRFDLLGATNNHVPVKIDWLSNWDYRFLVLPDAKGEVHGIDQLFGNNTTGPDGKEAANGYAALAKYDGMTADGQMRIGPPDGKIDSEDPIFPYLRVWLDKNFDGIAQPDELVPLADVGIQSIDLGYSSSYPEVDAYGNRIMMKSVVNTNDGLDLIFDLWFRYTP